MYKAFPSIPWSLWSVGGGGRDVYWGVSTEEENRRGDVGGRRSEVEDGAEEE